MKTSEFRDWLHEAIEAWDGSELADLLVTIVLKTGEGEEVFSTAQQRYLFEKGLLCPACGGTKKQSVVGSTWMQPCGVCDGTGKKPKAEVQP